MSPSTTQKPATPVFDIRSIQTKGLSKSSIESELTGLTQPYNKKILPNVLLYDAKGLQLFEQITYTHDYYLTNLEIDLLNQHADEMASWIQDGAALIELGAGALRKTAILLDAIERQGKSITFYALDLDHSELVRTLAQLEGRYRNITLCGLWEEAKDFVHGFGRALQPGVDKFIIAMDSKYNPVSAMTQAYNDSQGVTREFALNLLDSLNARLGAPALKRDSFEYCPYFNQAEGRNEAYLRCKRPVFVNVANMQFNVRNEELIRFAYSHKYDNAERELLWSAAKCYVEEEWLHSPCDEKARYSISLVAFQQ